MNYELVNIVFYCLLILPSFPDGGFSQVKVDEHCKVDKNVVKPEKRQADKELRPLEPIQNSDQPSRDGYVTKKNDE